MNTLIISIGHVKNIPTMHDMTGIHRESQSNNALWDTLEHALLKESDVIGAIKVWYKLIMPLYQ